MPPCVPGYKSTAPDQRRPARRPWARVLSAWSGPPGAVLVEPGGSGRGDVLDRRPPLPHRGVFIDPVPVALGPWPATAGWATNPEVCQGHPPGCGPCRPRTPRLRARRYLRRPPRLPRPSPPAPGPGYFNYPLPRRPFLLGPSRLRQEGSLIRGNAGRPRRRRQLRRHPGEKKKRPHVLDSRARPERRAWS